MCKSLPRLSLSHSRLTTLSNLSPRTFFLIAIMPPILSIAMQIVFIVSRTQSDDITSVVLDNGGGRGLQTEDVEDVCVCRVLYGDSRMG